MKIRYQNELVEKSLIDINSMAKINLIRRGIDESYSPAFLNFTNPTKLMKNVKVLRRFANMSTTDRRIKLK